jgi:molybdopterin-binding protein
MRGRRFPTSKRSLQANLMKQSGNSRPEVESRHVARNRAMVIIMTLSARNRLEGKITELQLGGVMAHVVVQVGDNLIESVITRRSAEEMNLKLGDTVTAVIKSTEVMLQKD